MKLIETVMKNLRMNRIPSILLESPSALPAYLDAKIPDGTIVGVGDSMTLEALAVYDYLRRRQIRFLDKYQENLSKEQKRSLYLRNFDADYFLSGVNAISATGKIYNLDGNGSRVAPIIYGPRKVVLLCGTNKITETDEEAIDRIRRIAAPLDAKRLGKKTPCRVTGVCQDCKSPEKICNYWTIIQGQFDENRIQVVFIPEELGY